MAMTTLVWWGGGNISSHIENLLKMTGIFYFDFQYIKFIYRPINLIEK